VSELSTLARPYAEAVFRLAQAESDLAGWSNRLATLAMIAADLQAGALIADPSVASARVADLMIDVAGGELGEHAANLVRVLAENGRLSVLPTIAGQFETLKAQAESVIEATITSALALSQTQIDELAAGLKTRFKREVTVSVEVDPELIGGAVIAVGDQVIDGSVKGRLERMRFALQG
jgi:F-type H+-transporting ATPase subunit delta